MVWHEEGEWANAVWILGDPVIRHEFQAGPAELRMIAVDGDSKEPDASHGDRLLIDFRERAPVPPGIFVIWDGVGLVTKRTEHVPDSNPLRVRLKSANPEYDCYDCLPTRFASSGAPSGSCDGSNIPRVDRMWHAVGVPDTQGLAVAAVKRQPSTSAAGMSDMLLRLHILRDQVPYDEAKLGA